MTNKDLVSELQEILAHSKNRALHYQPISADVLNAKVDEKTWSVLECLEHLNLYGDYYIPEMGRRMQTAKSAGKADTIFESGLLGNYFAELMQVKNGKMTKMSSPKDKNPNLAVLSKSTVDKFISQCDALHELLNQAIYCDLSKTKSAISLSPFIKLRLGDTFRFVIYHIERHISQADKALENAK